MTKSVQRSRRGTDSESVNPARVVRCAIYTRKSTDEGLDQDFNSLDAQREAAENYIRSQAGEGWVCLPDRYDDGGFTGGNMDRPALQRLMADINAGKIDCVVVYKVDRLSRSLMDFSRIMETFDRHGISFVSVTQHFNTTNSMGRLTLNILLSFAQFEREIISERTRDKMGAARKKGKWSGGTPVLGYDVVDKKLVVNAFEAEQVRQIFQLYLDRKSLLDIVQELDRRSWTTKRWTTASGKPRGGTPFDKNSLNYLLKNVVYVGQVTYQGETYSGEHAPIIDMDVFQRVHQLLFQQGRSGGRGPRPKQGGILSGLVRCQACGCSMTHTYAARRGKRYRYYVCLNAQKRGYNVCPAPTIPADELERFVVDQIRGIGRDPAVLEATWAEVVRQRGGERRLWQTEADGLATAIRTAYGELSKISARANSMERVAQIQEQLNRDQRRLAELRRLLDGDEEQTDPEELRQALEQFDPLWEVLSTIEQNRLLRLLLERVEFDGRSGEIELTFQGHGINEHAVEGEQS